jgi:hypothetical protein
MVEVVGVMVALVITVQVGGDQMSLLMFLFFLRHLLECMFVSVKQFRSVMSMMSAG